MKKNYRKKRLQGRTRLSGRNTLEVLNGFVDLINPALPQADRLHIVKTPKDLHELRKRLKSVSLPNIREGSDSPSTASRHRAQVSSDMLDRVFADIATNAWRAGRRMLDEETGEPKDGMKRAYRHVEALVETLRKMDIRIDDMQGRAFDSGMAVKVITFDPTPGLAREEITETIRPLITWQNRLIQMGEVIVGTPDVR